MREWMLAAGILLNSALYLGGCVAAGIAIGNPVAWRGGLAALGLTYVAHCLQSAGHRLARLTTWASVAIGLVAGLSLLWPV